MSTVLDYAGFMARFPEFKTVKANEDSIKIEIAAAHRLVDETLAGVHYPDIVALAAAHAVAGGPMGFPASKTRADGATPYSARLNALLEMVAHFPLLGACP
jgi:hypothetical protein